jgi:cyclic beta-1,2-glucan synthetase
MTDSLVKNEAALIKVAQQAAVPAAKRRRGAGSAFSERILKCDKGLRHLVEAFVAKERRPPAAAWAIDNYPDLHSALRDIRTAVPANYYSLLPVVGEPNLSETPRIEAAANALVAAAGGELNGKMLRRFFAAYQEKRPLTLSELWAAIHFVRFALIERVFAVLETADAPEDNVRRPISSLRTLERLAWKDIVEDLSAVDHILREDPSRDYPRLDFPTRDNYRHRVERCARRSRTENEDPALAEERVARQAIALAGHATGERSRHVGYWLLDKGETEWLRDCGYHHRVIHARRFILRHPNLFYLASAVLLTGAVMAGAAYIIRPEPLFWLLLLLLPALHVALAILNPIVTFTMPPRQLPQYDFKDGVPDEYRTFVVVPTLLLSPRNLESLLENLEIHYLANRDRNILFALLTDFPDSATPEGPNDHLLEDCVKGIERLNARYASGSHSPFYLFHRPRTWNASEQRWMGRERKRGKLNDFNEFLLGHADAFATKAGDLSGIGRVKFVITLDSDTQLPRDTARKLVGALAHPLNRPVLDPERRIVVEGYGLLQPRVGVSIQSSVRSRLARIYSGQVGYDPYATAVSDVYMDLYGKASFTGKGIYDIAAFEAAASRFPDNTLLSHDLIEGEHVRVGLAGVHEVIDDFPARYEAFCKRKHRWVRGDWQILRWMLPRVPGRDGRPQPNPLPLISRWKIFDNLRRSLMEPAVLVMFVAGWILLPDYGLEWSLVGLALFVLPVWFDLIVAAIRIPPPRFIRPYFREVTWRFARGHLDAFLTLAFLPQQALLMLDAISRTLTRQFITHRHLLEWESMAQVEAGKSSAASLPNIYLAAAPALALIFMFFIPANEAWSNIAFGMLEIWLVSPLIALWLDSKPVVSTGLASGDNSFLRDIALRTWRYFVDHATAENNWLAPDNVQEHPPLVALRTSPTNIGLQFNACSAALDFGFVTHEEFASSTALLLSTVSRLEKVRGHLLNWYDIRTLLPLEPHFVSAVDSGNFAASMIVLKQHALAASHDKLISAPALDGLRDHVFRLRDELTAHARTHSIMRAVDGLIRQLAVDPTDLFFWKGLLSEALGSAQRLAAILEEHANGDLHYWAARLVDRIQAWLDAARHFAPWLSEPVERELRFSFTDPTLQPLLNLMRDVPAFAGLPVRLKEIQAGIHARMASPEPLHKLTRAALEQLLELLPPTEARVAALLDSWSTIAATAHGWVQQMEFEFLFDRKTNLLRIGCGADGCVEDSSYDLLASEARTAVLLGIARGDMPREAWFHLGRKLVQWRGYHCLVSWSGTLFEYLMPNLYMSTWDGTLLHESCKSVVKIQQAWARERGIPWGISESAWNERDSAFNYQYHAFGVPVVAARRDFTDRLVVAPYATMLALLVDPPAAVANARSLAARGVLGSYGFHEAVDFSRSRRFGRRDESVVVRSFMAHHQGMTLLAIDSTLMNGPMQRRFHADPLIQAAEYLLQERVPTLLPDDRDEVLLPSAGPRIIPKGEPEIVPDELQKA